MVTRPRIDGATVDPVPAELAERWIWRDSVQPLSWLRTSRSSISQTVACSASGCVDGCRAQISATAVAVRMPLSPPASSSRRSFNFLGTRSMAATNWATLAGVKNCARSARRLGSTARRVEISNRSRSRRSMSLVCVILAWASWLRWLCVVGSHRSVRCGVRSGNPISHVSGRMILMKSGKCLHRPFMVSVKKSFWYSPWSADELVVRGEPRSSGVPVSFSAVNRRDSSHRPKMSSTRLSARCFRHQVLVRRA